MAEAIILTFDWCGHLCNEAFYLMGGDRRGAGVGGWEERGRDERGGDALDLWPSGPREEGQAWTPPS